MKIYGNAVGHPLHDPRKGMEMSGPINMNGQALSGIKVPVNDGDAVNWGSVKEFGKAKAIESTEHPGCYYRMVDGEKEWLNPPCLFGVDYRTADRNNGNPVYTKVINLGVLSADKDVNPNLPAENYRVFDYTVYVSGRISPTGWSGSSWDFFAYFSDNVIRIRSGSSFYGVGYNGYAQIWFCKGID